MSESIKAVFRQELVHAANIYCVLFVTRKSLGMRHTRVSATRASWMGRRACAGEWKRSGERKEDDPCKGPRRLESLGSSGCAWDTVPGPVSAVLFFSAPPRIFLCVLFPKFDIDPLWGFICIFFRSFM